MRWPVALVLAALLLAGCSKELSVQQQVIASLEQMEESAEEGHHRVFMNYVADGFSGQSGSMDKRSFHRFMIFQMNENRRLNAQLFPIHVKETGLDAASANFRILVTGGAGLLPDRGQLFEVATDWVRDNNEWLLSKADWEAVSLSQP